MELLPRRMIEPPAPGWPVFWSTVAPGVRPWMMSCVLRTGALVISRAVTRDRLVPTSRERCSPVAVTTMASSATASCSSRKSTTTVSPVRTVITCSCDA